MLAHKYVPVPRLTTLDKCQNIQHKDKKPQNEMSTTITIINTLKYKYNRVYTSKSSIKTFSFLHFYFVIIRFLKNTCM